MSDRDEIAEAIATHTPELVALASNGVDDGQHFYCIQCGVLPGATPQIATYHVADAVLAVLPSGDGPLREALRATVTDWQANGNSRPLGDPAAAVWHKAAMRILELLNEGDVP